MSNSQKIARLLLEKKAVKLNPKEPFTYVSGIRSPIYCDNRQMIAYPIEREAIIESFLEAAREVEFDVVAGTATAGIPWAAWVAERLNKPMAYIRAAKKEHGVGKQVEGADIKGKSVVVIEDLVSTGGSSFQAVEAARAEGAKVICMIAIFTYGFKKAIDKFKEGECTTNFLSDFSTLVKVAKDMEHITDKELEIILEWNNAPAEWGPKHGFPNAEPK